MRPRLGLLLVLPLLIAVTCLGGAGPAAASAAHAGPFPVAAGTSTAGSSTLQRSSTTSDGGTSWATSVPSFQQPTDKTDNEPLLIIGAALLATIVIGGLTALVRLRVRDDDAEL